MQTLPTGTVTFLMTDIEGSTRLWEEHPEAMALAVARHEAVVRDAVGARSGRVVKERGEGDSLFAVFERASDAVAAALEAQAKLTQEAWPEGLALKVRMALHAGESQEREGDFYGPTVNRTARLRAIGHGGQILLSQVAAGLVRDSLPKEANLKDLGSHRLKDLLRHERVSVLEHPALPDDFPPLRSLDAVGPNNLPVQLTSFVGRKGEVERLGELVRNGRIVTLTGSGGCGKTRLSLQVAAELLDAFPDGVWQVDLTPLTDPEKIPGLIAATLGLPEAGDAGSLPALNRHLGERRLLLLLDNCEHLVSGAARVVDALTRACPRLTVLATSRESLRLPGETNYRVPPLSFAERGASLPLEAVANLEAVRLFVERASARSVAFQLTESNVGAVSDVCACLDGIPLAVEQAASHIGVLSPAQILARLEDRFRLLRNDAREGGVPRHLTMRTVVDWSYGMLSEGERLLFERQAIFVGGWTLEAAEAVCADERLTTWDVFDALQGLIAKSLVFPEECVSEEQRYRYLETVREYAREKLGPQPSPLRDRHLAWCLKMAQEADPELVKESQGQWLEKLDCEHGNNLAALEWAKASRSNALLDLAFHLRRYWLRRGNLREGRQWLEVALESCPTASERLYAQAQNGLGGLCWKQGDWAAARSAFALSLGVWRKLQDREQEAAVLNNLGLTAMEAEDWSEAHRSLQESLELYNRCGDALGEANAMLNIGICELQQGDFPGAIRTLSLALQGVRRMRHKALVAATLDNLAEAYLAIGEPLQATSCLRECFGIWREAADRSDVAGGLTDLALVAVGAGRYEAAAELLGSAEALREAAGQSAKPQLAKRHAAVVSALEEKMSRSLLARHRAQGRGYSLSTAIEGALVLAEALTHTRTGP